MKVNKSRAIFDTSWIKSLVTTHAFVKIAEILCRYMVFPHAAYISKNNSVQGSNSKFLWKKYSTTSRGFDLSLWPELGVCLSKEA